ncbi:TPA: ABC transporter ATP-binding protein, partial [bacterium]|nr:ABC transporter ATP-binding protein [bacterium]
SNWVLNGFNISVNHGEIIGIIGPNGSGKTTALKLLSKVLKPTYGTVKLMGKDISDMKQRDIAKIIAVVPQGEVTAFPFTTREIVLMGRSPHLGFWNMENENDLRIADNAMALTDTLELADRNIDELSGGERQRVIIARALSQEPKIMLLDEPTSFLDINHQVEIFDLIKRLNSERDLTVIIVSHDLNMASEYCNRLILMKNGKPYIDGNPKEVITESNMKDVYEVNAVISDNIITGAPHIIPVSKLMYSAYKKHGLKVHLICGGGSGTRLMRWLAIEGFKASVGVLNISDSDYKIARSLEMETVTEAPFSHISDEAHLMNLQMAKSADVVILARVPIGIGNLKNMIAVQSAQAEGAVVIVFDGFEGMDYTDGRATEIFNELLDDGAIVAKDESDVFDILMSMEI